MYVQRLPVPYYCALNYVLRPFLAAQDFLIVPCGDEATIFQVAEMFVQFVPEQSVLVGIGAKDEWRLLLRGHRYFSPQAERP